MLNVMNYAIDNIQGAKTRFVKAFVTKDELKNPLQTYIDAQTTFAKKVVYEANDFLTTASLLAYSFNPKKVFESK